MNTMNQGTGTGLTRRGFLQVAGLTTAAFLVPSILTGCGVAANPGVTSMISAGQRQVGTDVLVIGGGMAGAFAAITAKAQGLTVALVDKGTVGRSGSTPWANGFAVFDESQGDDREEWIAGVRSSSEYVNNLDWLDQVLDESKDRWEDIVSWGMTREDVRHPSLVLRERLLEDGVELVERTMMTALLTEDDGNGNRRTVGAMGFSIESEEAVVILARATIMCAGAGAFKAPGFPVHSLTSDGDAMAYRVGAIITGKEYEDFHFTYADYPASCWNQWAGMWDSGLGQTSGVFTEGMTLSSAYTAHAGLASVSGLESESTAVAAPAGDMPEGESAPEGAPGEAPAGESESEAAAAAGPPSGAGGPPGMGGPPPEAVAACDGKSEGDDCEFNAPMGTVTGACIVDGDQLACAPEGGPPGAGSGGPGGGGPGGGGPGGEGQVLGAATGLGIHKAEGIWPTTMQGACNVQGLFAAGDGLGSMLCGSSYVGIGMSLSGSAVQGVAVGQGAAEYAQQMAVPTLSDDEIASVQSAMFAPRERETGFTPAWVTQVLQNTMFPYFVLMVKEQGRLEAALSTVTFLRENMVPHLVARDAHELRLAHETANMLLNAEAKLRASLFRTESRGTHYREDHPARDDDNWLAWVLLQMGPDGQMTVTREEIPDEWKPDLSIPYEERYPNRFPGELEFLGLA